MAELQAVQVTTQRLAAAEALSTVRIGAGAGRGAGVVIGVNRVLTNVHNVEGSQSPVHFTDGHEAPGTVLGADAWRDLAVLDVDTGGAPPLSWGTNPTSDVALGTVVWAPVNHHGEGLRITVGCVSAVGQSFRGPGGHRIQGGIEHTAPLMRGSSGGVILDEEGHFIGLNTHRLGGGFYLAISASADLKNRVDALARGETPRTIRLGIAVAPSAAARRMRAAVGLDERPGLLVRAVEADSPAEQAGLRRGDLVVRANDSPIGSVDDLQAVLGAPGPEVNELTLVVVHGAEERSVVVTIGP